MSLKRLKEKQETLTVRLGIPTVYGGEDVNREVTRQYNAIVKNLKDGMVLYVSAAEGDGKEETRKKAYVGFGFSKPDEDGFMYGRVKNGKIVPTGKEEFALGKKQRFD